MSSPSEVIQLKTGYSCVSGSGVATADGSITLVKGEVNVLVDTGGPWDKDFLLQALTEHGLRPGDLQFVIGTHGHSDHIGNLNLFPQATFIVCYDICKGHTYLENNLRQGERYTISPTLYVIPTPGHTGSDISLVVTKSQLQGTVVVAGDLFECEADIENPDIWKEVSENPEQQESNRASVLELADYIIPGHGAMFKVTEVMMK